MAAGATRPILYSYFLSSSSWRVRIALALKGIYYDYKSVDLDNKDHLREEFLKVNPCAEVPVLAVPGNILTNSTEILEYLEEMVPDPPLLPKNPVKAAEVRSIVDALGCDIQPFHNNKVHRHIGENSCQGKEHWIQSGFESTERILQKTHGTYCVGDNVTLADVCLVPQVFDAMTYRINVSDFPIIRSVYKNLADLCTFKDAHPFNQPDCPRYYI